MEKRSLLLVAALLMATTAISSAATETKQMVAAKAIQQLTGEMRLKMSESLQKGGPAGAIDVCAKDAPSISSRIEGELGVTIRRTSLKLRNPQNAPDETERRLLESLAAVNKTGGQLAPGVTAFPADPNRFYKVITMERSCLACHGELTAMSEAVRRQLSETYPEDQAVGYRQGDFRGIVSVHVK